MAGCDYNCSSCSETCDKKEFQLKTNEYSHIKKIIGVVSGKGGVGKSLVTSLLATTSSNLGFKTCILDGDVLGPSIPKMFGVTQKAFANENNLIIPAHGPLDIDIISTTMLLDNEDDPVIWRGSMVSSIIKQYYKDVLYGEQDVMFIDMPPGTGDVALTVFQSLPIDGIIVVTSPQDLVTMIVEKAVKMAKMMNVPILGLVENYAYIECPDCGKKIELFGKSKSRIKARENNIPHFISLPLNPKLAKICDEGKIYEVHEPFFNELVLDILK